MIDLIISLIPKTKFGWMMYGVIILFLLIILAAFAPAFATAFGDGNPLLNALQQATPTVIPPY